MNLLARRHKAEGAFTVAEMGIAVGVLGLLGLMFFQVLQSGLALSAKNTAVNAAHEEAKQGIQRLTRDLHASVSVPQLRDTSFNVVDSTLSPSASPSATPPTAAGVSFQNIVQGSPDYVWQDPGNPTLIMIKDGSGQPLQGMHLIIPAWGIEDDIAKVTASGTASHTNVFTVHSLETSIKNPKTFGGTSYAITYYTNRVMYLVQNGSYVADSKGDYTLSGGVYTQVAPGTGQYRYENGELHYYQWRSTSTNSSVAGTLYWKDTAVVARFLSNPQPFSVPLNRYGGPDNKYIKVQLSARDPKSTNRGYIATAALLDTKIDYRSRLTVFQ
jgi:type II secretory pathway pseudopilin PulG